MKKKIEEKPKINKSEKYQVIKSNADTSFGFWIIPLLAILLIGIIYIIMTLMTRPDFGSSPTNNKDFAKNYSFKTINLNENRARAGNPIKLDETTWGRTDPLAPPE